MCCAPASWGAKLAMGTQSCNVPALGPVFIPIPSTKETRKGKTKIPFMTHIGRFFCVRCLKEQTSNKFYRIGKRVLA